MISIDFKSRRTYWVFGLVVLFSLFALWIRLVPMFLMGKTDILSMVGSDDPLYNLRQVEHLLVNFPTYQWFDPMTLYPTGTTVYWGPLFIYISAIACMIFGATTRPEIICICLLVPPVMATLVTALMYFVGKACGDWKTGLLASGFTAIVSGQYFYRSLYGYFDHHIGEVLFSTLFCLVYIYAINSENGATINLKDFTSWRKTALLASLAGIAYLLGLFLMPTMILFAMIVGVFTIIQFIVDFYRNRSSDYLLIINIIIFTIAIIGLMLFGFKNSTGIDLATYSVGHIIAYLFLIFGTIGLYLIAKYLKGWKKYYYPLTLAGLVILGIAVLFFVSHEIFDLFVLDLVAFFGQQPVTNTVEEARGWALNLAWVTFNYGLLLMAGGFVVMIFNNVRKERPAHVFALVWSVIILFSTWQHIRYEYYLAVNVALLAAVCISFAWELAESDIRRFAGSLSGEHKDPHPKKPDTGTGVRGRKHKKSQKSDDIPVSNYAAVALIVLVAGLGVLFVYTSVSYSYSSVITIPTKMNDDWKESLTWMGNNTPDPVVNYFGVYDPKTFTYPLESYGVMSWWDYGHMITYIAKRIPNANPFQEGVTGPNGSAAYFMSTSEDTANSILDHDGTRYVVTDIEMDTGKFWAMSTWLNATAATEPYQTTMFAPADSSAQSYQTTLLNKQLYYLTMVSRLHNFDGSMAEPSSAYYIEYVDPGIAHAALPVITSATAMNVSEATLRADQYNQNAQAGYHATVLGVSVLLPLDTVPALSHYRLVHESPTNVLNSPANDLKYVKIFEYVKGAHIKGSGIIDIPLVTNTGRNFTYRQASVNSEFIVPYSTTGNPYDVKATGPYHIEGTSTTFDVPESAVMQGTTIN